MLAGFPKIQLRPDQYQCERHAITADGFGLGDNIRYDTRPFKGEKGTGTRTAYLHIVDHHQNIMLITDSTDPLQPFHIKHIDAAVRLYGFQHNSSWLVHARMVIRQKRFNIVQGV